MPWSGAPFKCEPAAWRRGTRSGSLLLPCFGRRGHERVAGPWRRTWRSRASRVPEACQRVARGRSAAQTSGRHANRPTTAGVAQTAEAAGRNPCHAIRPSTSPACPDGRTIAVPSMRHTRTFAPCRGRAQLPPHRGFAAVQRTAPAPTAIGYGRPLRGRSADATGTGPEARHIGPNRRRHTHHPAAPGAGPNRRRHTHHSAAPGTGPKAHPHTSLGQRPRNTPQKTLKG